MPPETPQPLWQEAGTRPSRALPYELHADMRVDAKRRAVTVDFANTGTAGAVFHVYDKLNLDRIPRRYTVETGKRLSDDWAVEADGSFDLWLIGPNGFVRAIKGSLAQNATPPVVTARYDRKGPALKLTSRGEATLRSEHYGAMSQPLKAAHVWSAKDSQGWYDLTVTAPGFEQRFAGRIETGRHGISDPAEA
jgi:phospholipase C